MHVKEYCKECSLILQADAVHNITSGTYSSTHNTSYINNTPRHPTTVQFEEYVHDPLHSQKHGQKMTTL